MAGGRVRPRARAAVVGIILGLLVSPAPVLQAATRSNAHARGVILLVGDSNLLLPSGSVVFALASYSHENNGYVPVFTTKLGATVRFEDCLDPNGCTSFDFWKIKLRETLAKVRPDAIVTQLGINDTASRGTVGGPGYDLYGKKIDWFMSLLPSKTPVFWTNLPCAIEPPQRQSGCVLVNRALQAARSRWHNLVVPDWATVADQHPEYISGAGAVAAVHYSAIGGSEWAKLIMKTLDTRLRPPNL